ncbi:MAG: hypothetical protein AB7T06_02705 [Kofleriaceae bacterium]
MGWLPDKHAREAMDERLLPAALRDQQLAARRIPVWLRIAIIVPAFVYAAYAVFTFTGPYRYFALLEVRVFGGATYHPQLAGLLTLLVCLVPPLVVTMILRKVFPRTPEELARPPRARAISPDS